MTIEIEIVSRFPLRLINGTNWLQLPSVTLVHRRRDLDHVITIHEIRCTVKGNPGDLANQIQSAYDKCFINNYPINLDFLIRFSPVHTITSQLPSQLNYFLGIDIDYIEKINGVSVRTKTPQKTCNLFYPEETKEDEEVPKHTGWLAIDFGTSNSTVTFFDSSEQPELRELPKQQKERLLTLFKEWLNLPSAQKLPDINEGDWQEFYEQVNRGLGQPLSNIIVQKNSASLLEAIRQIEFFLGGKPDPLRSAISKKLSQIYHEVLQVPPLQQENLVLAELDLNHLNKHQIISELELIDLGDPLTVEMGFVATNNRLGAISQPDHTEEDWKKIQGRFHHSPKRYLLKSEDEEFTFYNKAKPELIKYEQLIKAALNKLIEITGEFKDKKDKRDKQDNPNQPTRKFYRAVLTYPTVAPPIVRRQLKQMVEKLGFEDVKMDYDEAVAAALFYIWREFAGNKTIGLEAFKTRCRRSGDKWAQNVLVLDIGGGTTDLALIRLLLEDDTPFKPGDDYGAGGRYYVLTPDLMGSSGHLWLGGEYITLKLFRLLKVAIVDALLTEVAAGKIKNDKLDVVIRGLDQRLGQDGKFFSQSLLRCIDKENPESDSAYDLVLNYAEQVLPTRWKLNLKSLQAFYTLWAWAESAKIELSKGADEYEVSAEKVEELLIQNDIELSSETSDFSIKLNKQQLEQAAAPVVEEAIRIAKGLLESRLPVDESTAKKKKEPLDWLILSGQTCYLDLIKRKLIQIFSESAIEWDPARITFVPEYAKLATSVGACYGVRLQQYGYAPEGSIKKLRDGRSELFIKVKNLLYTLPCSFERLNQDETETILKPRQPLYQFNSDEDAKAQSEWLPVQPTMTIYRRDSDNKKPTPWAEYVFEQLAQQLEIYSDAFEYYDPFKVQFEVNQMLEISLLLCRGDAHYSFSSNGSNVLKNLNKKLVEELNKQGVEESVPRELIKDGKLQWEIAVGILEESPHSVFKAGTNLTKDFRYMDNGKEHLQKGLKGEEPLPAFPQGGKHTFYACYPSLGDRQIKPVLLGELGPEIDKTKDNYRYYVTIDSQGVLVLHEGIVPYWMSTEDVLKNQVGCVVEVKPTPIWNKDDDERNPFSGMH